MNEFMGEYLTCPRPSWNIPNDIGALNGKHVAIRKQPKSGSLCHNYKGFFSVILVAMVHAEYRFRWADVGTEGSCSYAYVFIKIKDGSIGFPELFPIRA